MTTLRDFIFRLLRQRSVQAALLVVALFFAGRRYFTEVDDLGVIKFGPIHPRPHPGTIAMFDAWSQMLQDHRPRLLVVRWLGESGDMEDLAEGQYDRPSGQLTVWTRSISSWAPQGAWKPGKPGTQYLFYDNVMLRTPCRLCSAAPTSAK